MFSSLLSPRAAVTLLLSCALSACGGGGGGGAVDSAPKVLSGTVTLNATAEVLDAASITATLPPGASGQPTCTLVSGAIPPGMALGAGCSLAGTPTRVGFYDFRLDLTIPGYTGSTRVDALFAVAGPILGPPAVPSSTFTVGRTASNVSIVGLSLMVPFSFRPTDSMTYRLVSGVLPPGMTLSASDGTLSGTPTVVGGYTMQIGATFMRNGQTSDLPAYTTSIGVI